MKTIKQVAIIGGGIGGLTVAQELAERGGFKIKVYEKNSVFGGKARSILTEQGYPGEMGIRTIGYVYRHFRDTLARIPIAGTTKTVLDNVVPTPDGSRKYFYWKDHDSFMVPFYFPYTKQGFKEYKNYHKSLCEIITHREATYFAKKVIHAAAMCEERRNDYLDKITWDEYFEADKQSARFRNSLIRLTEFYIGSKGWSNARSVAMLTAKILLYPVMHPIVSQTRSADMFNGPSTDVLIEPWVDYLKQLGVEFIPNTTAQRIEMENQTVKSVVVKNNSGNEQKIEADIYVMAVPLEVMQKLVKASDNLATQVPSIAQLDHLKTQPVGSIQFFNGSSNEHLYPHGWTFFIDSPWAILCMYQGKDLWSNYKFKAPLNGVMSATWANFDRPGVLYNKPAKECTAEELKEEVLAQMRMHRGTNKFLDDMKMLGWNLNTDMRFDEKTGIFVEHQGPLFFQPPNSHQFQPNAVTESPNLFLAADYVRTTFDLATMEAANEAGRHAVNGILAACKHPAAPCFVLKRPKTGLLLLEMIDKLIYSLQKKFKSS